MKVCTSCSRQPHQHPTTLFYRPDALPPNQQCQSTEGNKYLHNTVFKNTNFIHRIHVHSIPQGVCRWQKRRKNRVICMAGTILPHKSLHQSPLSLMNSHWKMTTEICMYVCICGLYQIRHQTCHLQIKSSANADRPRKAMCQSKCCQLLHNSVGTTCMTNPEQIEVMELEGYSQPTYNKLVDSVTMRSTVVGVIHKLTVDEHCWPHQYTDNLLWQKFWKSKI